MRILHIWNTAGVASIIAKNMDRIYGTQSNVLMKKDWDKFGFTTYGELLSYKHNTLFHKVDFILKCLKKAQDFDIIHVHGQWKILPITKLLYPSKPLIAHFHGTDIRGLWNKRKKFWKFADVLLYSTLDLKDEETPREAIFILNPVDMDLFYPKHDVLFPNDAFHITYNADNEAKRLAQQYGLKLVIHDRSIPYRKFADELCNYGYYIDVKAVAPSFRIYNFLSKTGLEALACGLKVINRDGNILEGLPEEHKPESVTRILYSLYKTLLK